MNAHTQIIPTQKADDLRRRTVYAERLVQAAQAFPQDYQREPHLALLELCDAFRFLVPDFADAVGEYMAELREWEGLDEEGYQLLDAREFAGDPIRGPREWKPLGFVL